MGKHLTKNDRLFIESLLNARIKKADIAKIIGCSLRTIYYECKRAVYFHRKSDYTEELRYAPEIAHERYQEQLKKKGRKAKILQDKALLDYISRMLIEQKFSPNAILYELNNNKALHFKIKIKSVNTIYNAIKKGYIPNVQMVHLPRGHKVKRKKKLKIIKRRTAGTSIEHRPKAIDNREEFGHWEMDTVKGIREKEKCMLVLTERKTRFEVIEKLKCCTSSEVVKALNRIEKKLGNKFYTIFKSITTDNGSEFQDCKGMEKALYRKGKRTQIYYCHPYAPHERGSNENNNILIRRWLPKGKSLAKITTKMVKNIQDWINDYPRSIFSGKTSWEMLLECGIKIEDI